MGKANVANALTLPGGTIVMLDGLDDAVDDDDALVGVFGHELGHIAGRVHDAASSRPLASAGWPICVGVTCRRSC
jgi:predicted Zn-dependent protease